MKTERHSAAQTKLLRELDAKRKLFWPHSDLCYRGPADFILRHGIWFEPEAYPADYPKVPPNHCFGMSIMLAAKHSGWAYVEGYMLMPRVLGVANASRDGLLQPVHDTADFQTWLRSPDTIALVDPDPATAQVFHHAWNVDGQGRLADATLENGALAYLGVAFSVERADDCTWNGDASVIDDFNRGYPLLQKPWEGEDWKRVWPRSKRLECIHRRDFGLFAQLLQEPSNG